MVCSKFEFVRSGTDTGIREKGVTYLFHSHPLLSFPSYIPFFLGFLSLSSSRFLFSHPLHFISFLPILCHEAAALNPGGVRVAGDKLLG